MSGPRRVSDKRVRDLLKEAKAAGCEWEHRSSGHYWVKAPDGRSSCFIAGTPRRGGYRDDRQKIRRLLREA